MYRILLVGLTCLPVSPVPAHAQDQPQPEQAQKIGPGIHPPVPINAPRADVPYEAVKKGEAGICLVSLIVDAKGKPVDPRIVRCTDQIFEANSLAAVMQYRFRPAIRSSDKAAVPVMITIDVNFGVDANTADPNDPPIQFRYVFGSPPDMTSTDPDSQGVYPLSKRLESPKLTKFASKDFSHAAMVSQDGTACDLVLVLDAKGRPQSASKAHCDRPKLEQPAIDSLMQSKFKPAKFDGKGVPVKMLVHLVYDGFGPHSYSGPGATAHP